MYPTLRSRGGHQSWWSPSFDLRLEAPASSQALSTQRYSGEVGLAALVPFLAPPNACWSRRSASVSLLPHSHPRMTLLEEPVMRQPPPHYAVPAIINLTHPSGRYNVNFL